MISAESLFLSESEPRELRYRLSLRFAIFAEADPNKRIELYQLMRNAYDTRSSVVHGAQLDEFLKLPAQGRVPVSHFVDKLEEVLRKTLHKAIETKPFSDRALVDWEDLILRGVSV